MKVHGRENIPREGGIIVAANHASFLDPPAVGSALLIRQVHFIARDTLLRNPFFRLISPKICVIPMSRNKGDLGALKSALRVIKEGKVVGLFPEGTRTRDGHLQQAKGGVGFLIAKAEVPVVPAYLKGTFQSFPRNAKWIRPHPVEVTFGKPIHPDEFKVFLNNDKDYRGIAALVMSRIEALKEKKDYS
jgi:1-acyl-sn-glycerol-3-phosphate acyltransferase